MVTNAWFSAVITGRMVLYGSYAVVLNGYRVPSCSQWFPMILNGCKWFSMVTVVISGFQWFSVVTSGSHGLPLIPNGSQWLSMVFPEVHNGYSGYQ